MAYIINVMTIVHMQAELVATATQKVPFLAF